jgi:beta-lactamase regulating signal transducer with metallopeptidase domain
MLAWMIYALVVAIPLSAGALLAEQAAKCRRAPTRGFWMISILASLLLPMVVATVSIRLPEFLSATPSATPLALRDTTSIPLTSAFTDWSKAQPYTSSTHINTVLRDMWLASSMAMMLVLGVSAAWLHRRKRRWIHGSLCGVPVLVSDSVGPAVVGLIRSRIVVPAWLLLESDGQQRYVIAHEQSHLKARDPLLVTIALILLLAMPWNPLLWWQFHRLRCAIEVDCDARVLRGGGDIGEYCETLIQVGQNQSGYVGAVAAMSESRSFLERRIRIMLSKPPKWARASALVLVGVSLGMVAFAAQVTPPAANAIPTKSAVTIDTGLLDGYEGFYEVSDLSLIKVTRKGDTLTVLPIGQAVAQWPIDVSAISNTEFLVPGLGATLDFIKGTENHAQTLIVHLHGRVVMTAPRVDQVTADQIREALAARIKNQQPFPSSDRALQLMLDYPASGAGMNPELAGIVADNKTSIKKYLADLGPVQSYTFTGVTNFGWDSYDIQHRNGSEKILFLLDKHGVIVNSLRHR